MRMKARASPLKRQKNAQTCKRAPVCARKTLTEGPDHLRAWLSHAGILSFVLSDPGHPNVLVSADARKRFHNCKSSCAALFNCLELSTLPTPTSLRAIPFSSRGERLRMCTSIYSPLRLWQAKCDPTCFRSRGASAGRKVPGARENPKATATARIPGPADRWRLTCPFSESMP